AGDATIIFDSQEDFIEINTQQTLRFGDRNVFELTDGTDPTQVQFYSNTYDQIKIGTDTTFSGVITAPYGQIYAFSRTTINGNLIARSVWVDTDSTVHPIQNCTEFNTEFDDTDILEMRDALSFEGDGWTIADANSVADLTLSDNYTSDGESSLEITLNNEYDATIENATAIDAVFSEGASAVTVKLDVKSNAVPYTTCNGEVSVYLKAVDAATYTLAGTLPYDPSDEYSDFMDTLSFDLSSELADLVMNEKINVAIKVSANQNCNPVFWLDELQFCDDRDGCNIQLPTMNPPDWVAPDEDPYFYDVTWSGDNSDIIENAATLSGAIRVLEDTPTPCTVTAQFEAVLGERIDAILGDYICTPGVDISFNINASDLPFNTAGMISQANILVTTSFSNSSGTITTFNNIADMRYYHHNTDGTITHFTEEVFQDTYDGYWFKSDPAVNNRLPLLDEDSDVVGEIESVQEGVDLNGPDGPDTDTIADTETATIILE
ncbi:MAG: hypothetical protein JXX14_23975, partial [Deltaproteobacteria bacterium]|nr:hypothetical protein [Deltaproteobacteria bacterium]